MAPFTTMCPAPQSRGSRPWESPPVYSAKTINVPATGTAQLIWQGSDFGGTDGTPITASANLSVTCNLPPQTAIDTLVTNFNYEIGT